MPVKSGFLVQVINYWRERMSELRKCKVEGGGGYSLFHEWTTKNGEVHAIVEHVSGKINVFHFTRISFVNSLWVTEGVEPSSEFIRVEFNVPVNLVDVSANVYEDKSEIGSTYDVTSLELEVANCDFKVIDYDTEKADDLAIKQYLRGE